MTDTELYEVVATNGVTYTDNEKDILKKVFNNSLIPVSIASKLVLTGVTPLSLVPPSMRSYYESTELFDFDSGTMYLKKYSLQALIDAAELKENDLKFLSTLYLAFLGLHLASVTVGSQDFLEDVRTCLMRVIGESLLRGKYGTLESIRMNLHQRRFIALWILFGVKEYHGLTIEKFFACFGEYIFLDARVKHISTLTNQKINEILFDAMTSDSDDRAIEWVESNIN